MHMRSVWQNFRNGDSHCSDCPGQEAPYPLGGIGDPRADIMLVGQEPAYNVDGDELADGAPDDMDWQVAERFMIENRRDSMNPLYKHMMNVAVTARCAPTDLYFTNLAKCTVDDASYSDCLEHCRLYFPREVAHVDPTVLLLHGSKVITTVFDMFDIDWGGSVGDVHGEIFETGSLKLVSLYHWGYAYRQHNIDDYNDDVADAVTEALA